MRIKGKGTFVAGRNGTDILHSIRSGFSYKAVDLIIEQMEGQ